jgi:ribosomal protein L40E
MASPNECPKCGHVNPEGAGDCENCGITFDIFSTEQEKARLEKEEAERAAAAAAEEAKYNIQCLKCGHMNSPITDDCIKCGIVFSKSYVTTEQELKDDPEKAAELAELLALKQRHEDLKVELLKKQAEEAARKEQEEKERLEALRKERERQETLRKEQEEKERIEAEKKEAERKKKEEEEKKRQEKLRKEKEEQDRIEAEKKAAEEKKRQAELEKEQERLKKEQEEKERIEAQKALEEEKKHQAEQERLDKERREQEAKDKEEALRVEKLNNLLKPKSNIKKLLKPYIGESVGMNYDVPTMIKAVKLLSVNDDYISVHVEDDETVFSYPLRNILSVAENIEGITTGGAKNKATFTMIIKVSHRMV